MSYNISSWTTKKLENLRIPLASFFRDGVENSHPEIIPSADGSIKLVIIDSDIIADISPAFTCTEARFSDPTSMVLKIEYAVDRQATLTIREMCIYGQWSGIFLHEILEPALKESTGYLRAICIWEGGDSISELTARDGEVSWRPIEL